MLNDQFLPRGQSQSIIAHGNAKNHEERISQKPTATNRTIYTYPYARDVRTNPTKVQYSQQQQQLQQNKMKILLKKQVPSPRSPTRKTTAWTTTKTNNNHHHKNAETQMNATLKR